MWLQWRVYEGEPREKAMLTAHPPSPNLDQGALKLINVCPQILPVHYEGGVFYLEDKKSR